jgi:16S rRNA (guanine966-N2)-methyltransferase
MNKSRSPGQVRIIGGMLRGSKLPVLPAPGLRPSSDRARETLFNWLPHSLAGKRALDVFAGSGALGFEAASRGAVETVLLERDTRLAESLRSSATRLKVAGLRVECVDALAWLAQDPDRRFDLVFLDPPFAENLWAAAIGRLGPWLAPGAWIYVEMPRSLTLAVPPDWLLYRQGLSREVRYALYRAA